MSPPLGFLGIPSLHSIIEAIASGFFGALANALVPGFLKHGTVATIQHLVALPDPATWGHVGRLQGDMTFLAAMFLPVTLAVGTLRYWLLGFTGQAHPVTAITRCAWVTGVLVAYGWIVGQAVAATNTLTHAILGFPTVGDGLQRIIGVLFGGALLAGAGGVFGAFLVIIGVLFAAGLFAAQVLLTVVLALLIVAGPPLIAVSAIPELSHLARAWAHALLATALVPLGWTVLFATAGALCLDATSFTGGATGLPGHVAAAFAGLITFILAVKLPWMLFGELRRFLTATSLSGHTARPTAPSPAPGGDRVRAAHARLRSAAFDGVPSVGRSVGRAAGAMGAPAGGPLGAARRGFTGGAVRSGILPATAAAGRSVAGAAARRGNTAGSQPNGVRGRLARAGSILRDAPADAKTRMANSARNTGRRSVPPATAVAAPGPAGSTTMSARGRPADRPARPTSRTTDQRRSPKAPTPNPRAGQPPSPNAARAAQPPTPRRRPDLRSTAVPRPAPGAQPAGASASLPAPSPTPPAEPGVTHPGRKISTAARRDETVPSHKAAKPRGAPRPADAGQPSPGSQPPNHRVPASRKPRPKQKP